MLDDDAINRLIHETILGRPCYCPPFPLEGNCPKCNANCYNVQGRPDYVSSLDAVARVEQKVTFKNPGSYAFHLLQVIGGVAFANYQRGKVFECDVESIATATARQRCEAILRATGHWPEGD